MKNYDPNIRLGTHTIKVSFQRWDYKGFVTFRRGGNCKGLDVLALDEDDLYDQTLTDNPIGFGLLPDVYVVYESKSAAGLVTQKAKPMYVNDSAAVANPLTNSVDFVYNNNPFNQEEHHEKTKADVVTYGAKFLKVDSGLFGTGIKATPLEGAEFAAKNAEGKYYGGLVDTDKDGVKEAVWVSIE